MNTDQKYAFDMAVHQRKNLFITGAGGVGKSWLINRIVNHFRSNAKIHVGLTSLTGVSAQLIKGKTLHSYLGIGLGMECIDELISKIMKNKWTLKRWNTKVLIIDEVSMMNKELFEKIVIMMRQIKKKHTQFGGCQLIVVGDFAQLPPVKSDEFCFESPLWNECIDHTIYLKKIIRQNDIDFSNALSEIRLACVSDQSKKLIETRLCEYDDSSGIIPTTLYSTNIQVDRKNKKYYDELKSEEHIYDIVYKWHIKQNPYELKNVRLSKQLCLKRGAQVMYLINNPELDLVNGSRGVVVDFKRVPECPTFFPVVEFMDGTQHIISVASESLYTDGKNILTYYQLPLTLSWCSTIHKIQGSTLDCVRIDLSRIFEYGQMYVALSRVRKLSGLYLSHLNWDLLKANQKIIDYYNNLT